MNALQLWESARQPSVVCCRGLPPESGRKVSEDGAYVNQNLPVWENNQTIHLYFNKLRFLTKPNVEGILAGIDRRLAHLSDTDPLHTPDRWRVVVVFEGRETSAAEAEGVRNRACPEINGGLERMSLIP